MKIFSLPMKEERLLKYSRMFFPLAVKISKMFPSLDVKFNEAGVKFSKEEFISMSLFSGFYFAGMFFMAIFFLGLSSAEPSQALPTAVLFSVPIGVVMAAMPFMRVLTVTRKRIKLLEKDLLFALKYLYIKVKSGIPLYDAMVGVAYGQFGEVSKEFKKTILDINSGIEQTSALETMALRNPSQYFRRTIWQLTNNIRAGADIAQTLESITHSLVNEHKIMIKKYGSELNPLILMYMMFTVIIPSLGITVIVVMSSFSGIDVPKVLFYIVPPALLGFQFFFISLIKNKRPLMIM